MFSSQLDSLALCMVSMLCLLFYYFCLAFLVYCVSQYPIPVACYLMFFFVKRAVELEACIVEVKCICIFLGSSCTVHGIDSSPSYPAPITVVCSS